MLKWDYWCTFRHLKLLLPLLKDVYPVWIHDMFIIDLCITRIEEKKEKENVEND